MEETVLSETLHVISVLENPMEYQRRYDLYSEYVERTRVLPHVELHLVELLYPGQESGEALRTIGVFGRDVMFHKENLVNIALARLPDNAKYAWIDADVAFTNPHWVEDTLKMLDTYPVVQLFGETIDLAPDYSPYEPLTGYVKYLRKGGNSIDKHPVGLAWAARKDTVPCLFDRNILGSGDEVMAKTFAGGVVPGVQSDKDYGIAWAQWQRGTVNINYVPGLLLHYWHGSRKNRQGRPERFKSSIFKEVGFSVLKDLQYNDDKVLEFVNPDCEVAKLAKEYFAWRRDDSTVMVTGEDESKI